MTCGAHAILLDEIVANTAKAQNTNFFASNFQGTRDDGFLRITVVLSSAVKVRLVPSSGTAFYFNGGAAVGASVVFSEDVPLDIGRTWNIQTDDAAGTTVYLCRVQELSRIP